MQYQVILADDYCNSVQVAVFEASDENDLRRALTKAFNDKEWWGREFRFVAAVAGDPWIAVRDDVRTESWF